MQPTQPLPRTWRSCLPAPRARLTPSPPTESPTYCWTSPATSRRKWRSRSPPTGFRTLQSMAQYSLNPDRCQPHNGIRQDNKECLFPVSPEPASYDPEEFVHGSQPWPRLLALKDGELLAKGEVFEHQTAARPKPAKHGSEPEAETGQTWQPSYSRPTLPTARRSC